MAKLHSTLRVEHQGYVSDSLQKDNKRHKAANPEAPSLTRRPGAHQSLKQRSATRPNAVEHLPDYMLALLFACLIPLTGLVAGWAHYAATFDPAAPLQVTFGSPGMGSFLSTTTRKRDEQVRLVTRPDLCGKAGLGMRPLVLTISIMHPLHDSLNNASIT